MIRTFRSAGTEDIFDGVASQAARRCCPQSIWPVARRKLDQINRVREINELKVPPGNRLERLKGDRLILLLQGLVYLCFSQNSQLGYIIRHLL